MYAVSLLPTNLPRYLGTQSSLNVFPAAPTDIQFTRINRINSANELKLVQDYNNNNAMRSIAVEHCNTATLQDYTAR